MPTPSRKTPLKIERMLKMHRAGGSVREIAEELKVSHPTIASWLRDAGLEPNGGAGARSSRRRREPDQLSDAIAGAAEDLAAASRSAPPRDRAGALAHMRARLGQMSELADQLAKGLPKGATKDRKSVV